MNSIKNSMLMLILFVAAGCSILDDNSDGGNGNTNNKTVFILCEGEFGAPNASVWSIDLITDDHSGPLFWNADNPLGDTGQSLKIHDDRLYVVVNNSHSVEVLNLGSGSLEYEGSLYVPNASPRYLEIVEDKGYLTCWGLNGILVFDAGSLTILDTIGTGGWPEMILNTRWGLFVTVPMQSYSDYSDKVLLFDPVNMNSPVDSFSVVTGPVSLLPSENYIYVGSTYYDENYNTYNGLSRIDPVNGTVLKNDHGLTFGHQKSLIEFNGSIYRLMNSGLVKVAEDLSVEQGSGPLSLQGGYSAKVLESKLYIGLTDYNSPDTVAVYHNNFELDTLYQVKALPTDFGLYDPEL